MKIYTRLDPKIRCKKDSIEIDSPKAIRLTKAFDEEMTENFIEDFNESLNANPKFIPLVIESYGGQVYSLLEIISIIKSSPVPVATICNGKAMSCGAMLFMFGSPGLRFMSEHATLMIHEVSSFSFGKVEEIKADAGETDRLNDLIFKEAALHIGKSDDYFLKMMHDKKHSDVYLTAKDAKKHNICNHIGVPEFITNLKVEQKLMLNGKEINI